MIGKRVKLIFTKPADDHIRLALLIITLLALAVIGGAPASTGCC